MLKKIREFLSQKGQGVVEYALLLGLAAVVVVGLIGDSKLQGSLEEIIAGMKEILKNLSL